MQGREYIDINMGRLTHEQAVNIARQLRYLWRYQENIYPNGDRKAAANLKVTKDTFGQYHFYINHMALKLIFFHLADIYAEVKQKTELDPSYCPPEVPDFLRWDTSSGSTPE